MKKAMDIIFIAMGVALSAKILASCIVKIGKKFQKLDRNKDKEDIIIYVYER